MWLFIYFAYLRVDVLLWIFSFNGQLHMIPAKGQHIPANINPAVLWVCCEGLHFPCFEFWPTYHLHIWSSGSALFLRMRGSAYPLLHVEADHSGRYWRVCGTAVSVCKTSGVLEIADVQTEVQHDTYLVWPEVGNMKGHVAVVATASMLITRSQQRTPWFHLGLSLWILGHIAEIIGKCFGVMAKFNPLAGHVSLVG